MEWFQGDCLFWTAANCTDDTLHCFSLNWCLRLSKFRPWTYVIIMRVGFLFSYSGLKIFHGWMRVCNSFCKDSSYWSILEWPFYLKILAALYQVWYSYLLYLYLLFCRSSCNDICFTPAFHFGIQIHWIMFLSFSSIHLVPVNLEDYLTWIWRTWLHLEFISHK